MFHQELTVSTITWSNGVVEWFSETLYLENWHDTVYIIVYSCSYLLVYFPPDKESITWKSQSAQVNEDP